MTDELEPCTSCGQRPYTYIGKDMKTVLARDLEDERDRLREALADAAPKVKPLEWRRRNRAQILAGSSLGFSYSIKERGPVLECITMPSSSGLAISSSYPVFGVGRYKTLDEAKAAAQSDYESRILSALEGHK